MATSLITNPGVTLYDSWQALEPLKEQWNDLVRRSATREIFLTFDFLRAWWQSGVRPSELAVIVVRRGAQIAGIAPLMIAERTVAGHRLRTLEFLGTPADDYADFLLEDDWVLGPIWREIEALMPQVDLLYLQQIKETSPTCDFLRAQPRTQERRMEICWSAMLPEQPDAPIAAYLKSPGFRPRVVRRLEKEGNLTLATFDQLEGISRHLPILFTQHIERWRELGKVSPFTDPTFRAFYFRLSEALAPSRNIVLTVMRLNEIPIASFWGFEYDRKLLVYTLAFDPAYRKFYAGLVFLVKVMQGLRGRGIERIDLSRGAERFKAYFCDMQQANTEFLLPRTLTAQLLMKVYYAAKDWAMAREPVKDVLTTLGYRGETVPSNSE